MLGLVWLRISVKHSIYTIKNSYNSGIAYSNLYHPPWTTLHHRGNAVHSNLTLGPKNWVIYEHIWGEVWGEAVLHIHMVCQVCQKWSIYLPRLLKQLDIISVPVLYTLDHFGSQERVDIPSLTWKPRTMDKSKTCPGHSKDLSCRLDDLGLLILGYGHCFGTTTGHFKILPHRATS